MYQEFVVPFENTIDNHVQYRSDARYNAGVNCTRLQEEAKCTCTQRKIHVYTWLNGFIQGHKHVYTFALYLASDLYCTYVHVHVYSTYVHVHVVYMHILYTRTCTYVCTMYVDITHTHTHTHTLTLTHTHRSMR